MTPREKRELITGAIIDDIVENVYEGFNLEIIRDALATHYACASWSDIEKEYKQRGIA
jgi:hypothetical protein